MKKDYKALIILTILFLLFSIINFGKSGNIFIDFSREAYIPFQMLNGQVLVKDIFLIYGFWGYFVNFLIYKFIGVNINYILIESTLISFLMLLLFYKISREFINIKESILLSVMMITINIYSMSTFNYTMPYSYSTLWGYFGSYLLLYFLLKKKYKLAFLIIGFIFINKIELAILLMLVSLCFIYKTSKQDIKQLFYMLIFPIFNVAYLIATNVKYSDIINNLNYINKMINTNALDVFYHKMGIYFNLKYFIYCSKLLFLFIIVLLISYFLYKRKKIIFSYLFFIIAFYEFILTNSLNLLALLLIYPLFVKLYKKKKFKTNELLMLVFSIVLCLKTILMVNYINYANYAIPILVLTLYFMYKKFVNKKWLFNIVFIIITFLFIFNNNYRIKYPKTNVNTNIGSLYVPTSNLVLFNGINYYFKDNLKDNETFIVVPEGQIFNLIFKSFYPYYYSTFTPLDFETFGDDRLVNDIKKYKPTYIVLYPRDTNEYGANLLCYDYAKEFCAYIMNNYKITDIIDDKYKTTILKRK